MKTSDIVSIVVDLAGKGFSPEAIAQLIDSREAAPAPAVPPAPKPEPREKRAPKRTPKPKRSRRPGPSILSRALKVLRASPMTVEEISAEIKADPASVRVALTRAAAKGLVVKGEAMGEGGGAVYTLPFQTGTTKTL